MTKDDHGETANGTLRMTLNINPEEILCRKIDLYSPISDGRIKS